VLEDLLAYKVRQVQAEKMAHKVYKVPLAEMVLKA
jgi:hypothetical protein